jgi:RalA-binding protein 1
MNIFGRKSKKDGGASPASRSSKSSTNSSSKNREQRQVLGVPLKQALKNSPSFDGVPVPALVRECLDYVSLYGLLSNY